MKTRLPPYTLRPIVSLLPYAQNPRTHSDDQVEAVANSIKEFGFTQPVLIGADGGIIAGHCRVAAANKLGMKQVPTIELAHLTDAQRRAYIIADNQLTLRGGWDFDRLHAELAALKIEDFDLSLTGFDDGELAKLLAPAGQTDPNDAPEPQEQAISRTGDLWLLGRHRLLCGDCTDAATVERALGGAKPHLMVTDPPYGVDYDPDWRNEYQAAIGEQPTYKRSTGAVANDANADWRDAWTLFPGAVAYMWHADLGARAAIDSLEAAGFHLRSHIIWVKNRHSFGRGHYHSGHEPLWYAVRKGQSAHWNGDRKQSTVWEIDRNLSNDTGHSTQKPVECMKRPIENNSRAGDAVYDPFVGSFTTGIACEMTGRRLIALEISPTYVDIGIRRWQEFSGKIATLDGDGRTFAEIEQERS